MKSFLLSFDLPREMNPVRLRVFRALRKMNAEKVHDSLWRSSELEALIQIALLIKRAKGKARILEEKFVF